MRPIRVLHLRYTDQLCGPGRIIMGNVRGNTKGQICYYVGSFLEAGGKKNAFLEQIKPFCRALEIPTPRRFTLRPIWYLRSFIRSNNINIIHCHDYKSNIFGLLAARMEGIPVVATVHGWITNSLKETLYVALDRSILRRFDAVISVSKKLYGEIQARGVANGNLWLIPNGVVLENFSPEKSRPVLRDELNLLPEAFLIGNIGRLSREKGQAFFLEAARQIANRHPAVRFVIVGDGPLRNSLYGYVKQMKLDRKVFFTGHRTDMPDIYRSLDLMVLSSTTEGLPMVMLEAMASMIPVVATDVGGCSEAVRHQETGLMVPSSSSHALAEAMECAITNREAMQKMGRRAFEYVSKEFDFKRNIDKTVDLYQRVMSEKEGRIRVNGKKD